jgi:hypothetical protein
MGWTTRVQILASAIKEIFSLPMHPAQLWGLPSLLSNEGVEVQLHTFLISALDADE